MDHQKNHQREGKAISDGFGGGSGGGGAGGGGGGGDAGQNSNHPPPQPCPRCHCDRTKFCYFNNYSLSQPRYYCKGCKRYWTQGGTLRNVPVGGGCRKNKRPRTDASTSAAPPTTTPPLMPQENYFQHQRLVTAALGGANSNGSAGTGDMLFGVSENTNAATLFLQTLLGSHEPRQMSQPPHLRRDLGFGNSLTLRYLPNNQENPQLFPNVYSIREAGSSSASAAAMTGEWTIGGVQPDAPQLPPSLLASNNDNTTNNIINNITVNDDDENDVISRQWAEYMGNGGLGGEP